MIAVLVDALSASALASILAPLTGLGAQRTRTRALRYTRKSSDLALGTVARAESSVAPCVARRKLPHVYILTRTRECAADGAPTSVATATAEAARVSRCDSSVAARMHVEVVCIVYRRFLIASQRMLLMLNAALLTPRASR